MKSAKKFFTFAWIFLFAVTCIPLPSLIKERDFKNIIILFVVVGTLAGFNVALYTYFKTVNEFRHFVILKETIKLYGKNNIEIPKENVKKITVTPYRYIFSFSDGKRKSVSRMIGWFQLESHVNPAILLFSENTGTPIIYGMF